MKGGPAQVLKEDLQPHLSIEDSADLLRSALQVYRREHRTLPARVVLHKTSSFTASEVAGFRTAGKDERVDQLDLLSLRRSLTRLFRTGTYPPLRGTLVELDGNSGIIYLRGSVEFFKAYPGAYVPRPLEFRACETSSTIRNTARELLALSKLNWNNTQFDGGEPITLRAARRVSDILKCVGDNDVLQPSFRFFM